MDVQTACENVVEQLEGSLGCMVIEPGGRIVAAACPQNGFERGALDLIALAVSDLFWGKLIRQFYAAWSSGGQDVESFVREVQLATISSYQFASALPGPEPRLMVLITDRTVSLGLGWMSVRQGLKILAAGDVPHLAAHTQQQTRGHQTRPLVELEHHDAAPEEAGVPPDARPVSSPILPTPLPSGAHADAGGDAQPTPASLAPEQAMTMGPRARMFTGKRG